MSGAEKKGGVVLSGAWRFSRVFAAALAVGMLAGTARGQAEGALADGGDSYFEMTIGGVTYGNHVYTTQETDLSFTPSANLDVEYFAVGGGGSGGAWGNSGRAAGGGGAGGMVHNLGGTKISLSAMPYTIRVGKGGNARSGQNPGYKGNNSVISFPVTVTAEGGGAGGSGSGGCGGGATPNANYPLNLGGTGNQGRDGGDQTGTPGSRAYAAGGGGITEEGGSFVSGVSPSGDGGDGIDMSAYFGTTVGQSGWFGGGGGGGIAAASPRASGGNGGGGRGDTTGAETAEAGTPNTGGGGGGQQGNSGSSGAGGSGIVIIRYVSSAVNEPEGPVYMLR
ncbi:MAG: hypothetical protein FJ224_06000 [Lentisphaerae bacterium]|nr:hypothetical protein [Lentisphaerota bacterium]